MKRIHVYLPDSLAERLNYFIEMEGFKGPSEVVRFMIKYFEYLPPTEKRTNISIFRMRKPYKHVSFQQYTSEKRGEDENTIKEISSNANPPPGVHSENRSKYFTFYP
jgi:metal-responsive CopG/Arc/MetJ family transcriptional regulator